MPRTQRSDVRSRGRGQAVPITNPRPHQPQNPPSCSTPRTQHAPVCKVEHGMRLFPAPAQKD